MSTPEIFPIRDAALGLDAWVVIDSLFEGQASGGLRMHADVTPDELTELARTMTHKYGFYGLPKGGAKAGIRFDPEGDPERVRRLLFAFGEKIAELVHERRYFPGPDMGTDDTRIRVVLEGAQCDEKASALWNTADSGRFTAAGVMEAFARVAKTRSLDVRGARVQIEGIGAVGGNVWRMLHERGVHVVAVSNRYGAIAINDGLSPLACLEFLSTNGGSEIAHIPGAKAIDRAAFLALETDAFLPCAGSFSLDAGSLRELRAPLIVPGANNPLTGDAMQAVHGAHGAPYNSKDSSARLLIPDFVANAGGVVGGALRFAGMSADETVSWVTRIVGSAVTGLLRGADAAVSAGSRGSDVTSLTDFAEQTAEARFDAMRSGHTPRLLLWGMRAKRLGLVPEVLGRIGAARYAATLAERVGNLTQ